MIVKSDFKAAWWLSNCHLQTISAKLLRRNEKLTSIKETLELPDGDFTDLAWTQLPDKESTRPIILILHGLEGSIDSHYVKGIMTEVDKRGWIGLLMHFRGCGGLENRQASSYHSGDIRDITYLAELLKIRYANAPLFLVGFSLGGNVIARYLSQEVNNPFKAASIVCAPLHLASCSKAIDKGISKIYQKYLVEMLKTSTQSKIDSGLITNVSAETLASINTMYSFDENITAPINGFESADDYYQKMSGLPVLHQIKQPFLVVHAADDPFLFDKDINYHHILSNKLPSNITVEISPKGGHVGFITGKNPFKPTFWLDQRIPNFIEQYL